MTAASSDVREICTQADTQSTGIYRTIETHLTLEFVEPNAFRMDYRWRGRIEAVTDMRFVERRSGWSGKGIEGPPKVAAQVAQRELQARRHGSVYRSDQYEKYLIDLGEDIPAGSIVDIQTESRYVDEAATFKPFLSTKGRPSFELLSLTVESVLKITSCQYKHLDDSDVELSVEPVDYKVVDGLNVYTKSVSPANSGKHRLIWTW